MRIKKFEFKNIGFQMEKKEINIKIKKVKGIHSELNGCI